MRRGTAVGVGVAIVAIAALLFVLLQGPGASQAPAAAYGPPTQAPAGEGCTLVPSTAVDPVDRLVSDVRGDALEPVCVLASGAFDRVVMDAAALTGASVAPTASSVR